MESTAFPWLRELTDEEAYRFLGELIEIAQGAGGHTTFLRRIDALVFEWSATDGAPSPSEDDDRSVLTHPPVPREAG
ncbi:hypothetical protein ACFYXS_02965 [Streptomyces sp. NPDC002574]|uniref:hypothetical protein n=1 Tax=Streptomyces sp. NPDC002574 TaxID=3364652 RepID=UPI0036C91DC2